MHQQQEKCLTPPPPEPFSNNNNESIVVPNEAKTQNNQIVKTKMRIMSVSTSQHNKTVIDIQKVKKPIRRLITLPLLTTTKDDKENNLINETKKGDK